MQRPYSAAAASSPACDANAAVPCPAPSSAPMHADASTRLFVTYDATRIGQIQAIDQKRYVRIPPLPKLHGEVASHS